MTAPGAASLDMIRRLVGFDTVSSESNLDLIEFAREHLAGLGAECRLFHDESGAKANLYATLGPPERPGILLSGHTDVVPVEGQDWDSDPFVVNERDGRLYGRGTADMKSFIAVALALAPEFVERGLETPLNFSFSYDEEVGCIGVRSVVAALAGMPVKPAMCIVGEPTDMKVVTAHKGKRAVDTRVRGLACHSSLAPSGVNAVEYAAELIAFMKGTGRRLASQGYQDADYDVPHTTVHVGRIEGGTALNIVPADCRFEWEFRHLPADDPDALYAEFTGYAREVLEPEMHAVDAASGFEWQEISSFPGLDTDPAEAVVTLVKELAGRNDHGKVAFGTEAGLFSGGAGIPTAICGPGSIDQAHKPNEFITLEQVAACEAFMRRLMDRVCRK